MSLHDICSAVTIPADSADYAYQIRPIEAALPSFTKLLITLELDVAEQGYTYNYGYLGASGYGYSYGYTPATMSVYFFLQVSRDGTNWHNTSIHDLLDVALPAETPQQAAGHNRNIQVGSIQLVADTNDVAIGWTGSYSFVRLVARNTGSQPATLSAWASLDR
jgi:hypothetical protein